MFETEVQAGIAVLEEKGIGWRSAALHPDLWMRDERYCILGRSIIPTEYSNGYRTALRDWEVDDEWMARHGFYITDEMIEKFHAPSSGVLYAELEKAWRHAAQTPGPVPVPA